MAKRKTYSDKFKAGAIVLLQSEGYPQNAYALQMVADKLKVPSRTLRRWHNGENGQPPVDVVQESKKEMVDRLNDLMDAFITEMHEAASGAPLNHIATAYGIVFDKRQLLTGGPTARGEVSGKDGGAIVVTWGESQMVEDDGDARD